MSDLQNDKSILRFVLLWHETPEEWERKAHFDLMIEFEDVLETWELPSDFMKLDSVFCRELEAHRKHYLDYEGPLSNDRGSVRKHDSGEALWLERKDGHRLFELRGSILSGSFRLSRDTKESRWTFERQDSSAG